MTPFQRLQAARSQAAYQSLLGLGQGLLANPNPMVPSSFGSALQRGGAGFNQGYRNAIENSQKDYMAQLQMEALRSQQQDRNSRMEAQSQMFGGYDPNSGVTWNQGREMTPSQRLQTMARAYPDAYGQAQMSAMFPTPQKPTSLMQNLEAAGLKPGTPEYNDAMRQAVLKPGTTVNVNSGPEWRSPTAKLGQDYEQAQLLLGPDHPTTQALRREMDKAGTKSGEQLRTEGLIESGSRVMNTIYGSLINEKGEPDMWAIRQMAANIPFDDEGRTLNSQFLDVASAILRLETGSEARESEIQNTAERYKPSVWDGPGTAKDKLDRLKARFDAALKLQGKKQQTSEPDITMDDVEYTAKQNNMTVDQVIEAIAKREGMTVEMLKNMLGR